MKIVILDGYCLNPGDLDWKGFDVHAAEKTIEFLCRLRAANSCGGLF